MNEGKSLGHFPACLSPPSVLFPVSRRKLTSVREQNLRIDASRMRMLPMLGVVSTRNESLMRVPASLKSIISLFFYEICLQIYYVFTLADIIIDSYTRNQLLIQMKKGNVCEMIYCYKETCIDD